MGGIEHILFWASINHFDRIRKYGFTNHLKYVFNCNLSRVVISLQMELKHLPEFIKNEKYSIREVDYELMSDINVWVNLINNSYSDIRVTASSFKEHVFNHRFLENIHCFILYSESEAIGTISVGTYRKNKGIAGDARIAIDKKFQGKGIGMYLVNFGFNFMKSRGIHLAESKISFMRKASFFIHFKCGFIPQLNREFIQFNQQKRMFFIYWYTNFIIRRYYMKYLNHVAAKFKI